MSEPSGGTRPRQVTAAVFFALVPSILLVLSLFDTLGQMRSANTRASIEKFLAEPPGSGLGLDAGQVVELLRMVVFVGGAAAAAAAVLSVYLLQRHRGARIAFTVAAGVLVLSSPVIGILPFFVAAAAILVWSGPARAWYAGRPQSSVSGSSGAGRAGAFGVGAFFGQSHDDERPEKRTPGPGPVWPPEGPLAGEHPGPGGEAGAAEPGDDGGVADPDAPAAGPESARETGQPAAAWPAPTHPPSEETASEPAAYPPPSYAGGPPPGYPPPSYPPAGYAGGYPVPGDPRAQGGDGERPLAVAVAAFVTWASCALTAGLAVLVGLVMVLAQDQMLGELEADPRFTGLGLERTQVVATLWILVLLLLFWCLAAFVLAILAFRRVAWARVLLAVSAAMAILFSLLAFPLTIAVAMVCGPVLVLLFTGSANRWYAEGRARPGSFAGPGGPPPPGPPPGWQPEQRPRQGPW